MMFYTARIYEEDDVYLVEFPDLFGTLTYGETLEEAKTMAKEAMDATLMWYNDEGEPWPEAKTEPDEEHGFYAIEVSPEVEKKLNRKETLSELKDYLYKEAGKEPRSLDADRSWVWAGLIETIVDEMTRKERLDLVLDGFYKALDEEDFSEAEKILNDAYTQFGAHTPELASCPTKLSLAKMRVKNKK